MAQNTGFTLKNWAIEELTGYKPKTTFYIDFSIADRFGKGAILDTFNRAFDGWKDNVEYITELTMVMSWKSFEHEGNREFCELYSDLYYKLNDWVFENLEGEDLQYFIRTTD